MFGDELGWLGVSTWLVDEAKGAGSRLERGLGSPLSKLPLRFAGSPHAADRVSQSAGQVEGGERGRGGHSSTESRALKLFMWAMR